LSHVPIGTANPDFGRLYSFCGMYLLRISFKIIFPDLDTFPELDLNFTGID